MFTPKQEPYYILTYKEFNELIQKHFIKPTFECIMAYDWDEGREQVGTVSISRYEKSRYSHMEIQHFINDAMAVFYPPDWMTLLEELAKREEIPEGKYLLKPEEEEQKETDSL